jgi:hypothetical protein
VLKQLSDDSVIAPGTDPDHLVLVDAIRDEVFMVAAAIPLNRNGNMPVARVRRPVEERKSESLNQVRARVTVSVDRTANA